MKVYPKRKTLWLFALLLFVWFLIVLFGEDVSGSFIVSDDFVLYSISVLTLFLILFYSKTCGQLYTYLNIALYLIYGAISYYGLFFKGEYGSGLIWWSLAVVLTSIHFLILLIYLAIKFWKK